LATKFKPGDKVLVLAGLNKGARAIFKYYTAEGKAFCKGPGGRLHRIRIKPEKLRLIKKGVAPIV